jgi:aspartate aminotransferase/aminotransferase
MTGWRLGFAHGPAQLIQEMSRLQQFSYVCAPAPLQKGVVKALDLDLSATIAAYRKKRDMVVAGLEGYYDLTRPGGAFYAFPKVPARYDTGTAFAAAAVEHNLIVIPGNVFSRRDTHFRISYAVEDGILERGIEVLRRLAGG